MAVEYVRRGEIYRVRLDTGIGSEQGVSRPALIISSNSGNSSSPLVVVAYMTTKDHNIGIHYGPTKATGVPSYVQCEQIYTVHKSRLVHLMGSLSENEMRDVDSRLDEVLDLGWVDDAPLKEKEQTINALKLQLEELKSEVFSLKTSLSGKEDEILTRDVEIAVHKRMYEKAVDMIAAIRVEPNPPKKVEQPKEVPVGGPPKQPEPEKPKSPKPKKEPKLVDINTATFSQLRGVGLSNGLVLSVINDRPYKKVEDLKKVPGLNGKIYGIVEKKVCCIPVAEPPKEVETPAVVETPKVEETPVVVPVEVVVEENVQKVNVNTASAREINEITGLSLTACFAITGKRNREGLYKSLDELVIPGRLSAATLEKYRDKMEV